MGLRASEVVVEQIVDGVERMMDVCEADGYARELRELRERSREANDSRHFVYRLMFRAHLYKIWCTTA